MNTKTRPLETPSAGWTALAMTVLLLAGCSGSESPTASGSPDKPAAQTETAKTKEVTTYKAMGATFPAILYEKWFEVYNNKQSEVKFEYNAQGSGAGVRAFTQGLVAFGASDAAMNDDEIAKVDGNVVMLPMTAGSVVVAYNLPEVEQLKLSRENLIAIFTGEITNWNAPKLAKDNPKLPDLPIVVVRRAGSSGTTFAFTKHLSAISPKWKDGVGAGKSVQWPVGEGAKGNGGISQKVKETPGALGYINHGYAVKNELPVAMLQNKAGKFVGPTTKAEQAALSNIELPANLRAFDADPAGEDSYPIVTFTWWLCSKQYKDPAEAKAVKDIALWAVEEGQNYAKPLGYIPLPDDVRGKIRQALQTIK